MSRPLILAGAAAAGYLAARGRGGRRAADDDRGDFPDDGSIFEIDGTLYRFNINESDPDDPWDDPSYSTDLGDHLLEIRVSKVDPSEDLGSIYLGWKSKAWFTELLGERKPQLPRSSTLSWRTATRILVDRHNKSGAEVLRRYWGRGRGGRRAWDGDGYDGREKFQKELREAILTYAQHYIAMQPRMSAGEAVDKAIKSVGRARHSALDLYMHRHRPALIKEAKKFKKQSHAARGRRNENKEDWAGIFDSLKPGQHIEVALTSIMGRRLDGSYREYKVGRRSHSKKYNVTTIRLDPPQGPKPPRWTAITLLKRNHKGVPSVSAAHGDMGLILKGIRTSKGRARRRR